MQSSIKIERKSVMVQNSLTFKNNSTKKETPNDYKIIQTSNPKLRNEDDEMYGNELILNKTEKKKIFLNSEMQTSLEENIHPVKLNNFERSQQTIQNSFINSQIQTSFDNMEPALIKEYSMSKKNNEVHNSINFEEKYQQTSHVEFNNNEFQINKDAIQLKTENKDFPMKNTLELQNAEMQTNQICIREMNELNSKSLQTSVNFLIIFNFIV